MLQRFAPISIAILFLTFFSVNAQVRDCEQTLALADDEFAAGKFFGIPSLLKPCLESGFSKEQKVRAYLILTQAYLILDDPISAEDSYLKLLNADPEYVANPIRDPIDVYYLSKKFTTTPVFTPHLRLGLNTSRTRLIQEVNTSGLPLVNREIFKPGFQIGAGVDLNINNQWSIGAELNFSRKAYKKKISGYFYNDDLEFTESQSWFDIPLYVKYAKDSGKIRPFAYMGLSLNLLVTSKVASNFNDFTPSNSEVGVRQAIGAGENIMHKRNYFNRSIVIGTGLKYKIGRDFVFGDVRYMLGLSNLTNPSNNFYNADKGFDVGVPKNQFVSDLFRIDNLAVSVGYIRPIYNPRKKHKPKMTNLFNRKNKVTDNEVE